ncbi:MAG TPA: thiamine-phosphate kinase [Geobacteraceae bacterium]|nr:thiamine-phosphate kinase [Geobacteraceae bacterium]
MKLAELGEFGFIGTIAARTGGCPGVTVGIGDDAAATLPTPGMSLLTTADLLAEGVHFNRDWIDPYTLGRKSLAVNLSDIAAMGGIPRYALLSLAVPEDISLEFLDSFTAGFLDQAKRFNVALIGGDTSASRGGLFINVTLMGEQYPEKIVTRGGARAGDLICVSGTLGDSALGLEALRRGERVTGALGRHLDPEPRVSLGVALADAAIPTAMIDISDGLVADLGHILKLSGNGGRVEIAALPLSAEYRGGCARFGADPYALCLGGGEDYELLFTLPAVRLEEARKLGDANGAPVTVIGEIVTEPGLYLAAPHGGRYDASIKGYDHFRTAASSQG